MKSKLSSRWPQSGHLEHDSVGVAAADHPSAPAPSWPPHPRSRPKSWPRLGAEATMTVGQAVVATFTTRAAATAAASTLSAAHPTSTVVVDVADTTGEPTDPAVTAVAKRATAADRRQDR